MSVTSTRSSAVAVEDASRLATWGDLVGHGDVTGTRQGVTSEAFTDFALHLS